MPPLLPPTNIGYAVGLALRPNVGPREGYVEQALATRQPTTTLEIAPPAPTPTPGSAIVVANAAPLATTIQNDLTTLARPANALVIADYPELRPTQIAIAKLRLWRDFCIENSLGAGFLAVGVHDLAWSASAILPVLPAWQWVALGLLSLGVSPQLVQFIASRFGTPGRGV